MHNFREAGTPRQARRATRGAPAGWHRRHSRAAERSASRASGPRRWYPAGVTHGRSYPVFEFHVSRTARERYGFDDSLFSLSGNIVLANLAAVRRFAQRVNERRAQATPAEPAFSPGDLNAMGLVDEVFHYVIAQYQRERDPRSLALALEAIDRELGRDRVDQALIGFIEEFPPVAVHRGAASAAAWLSGASALVPHRVMAIEELLMLRLANENPAIEPFRELLDDRMLPARAACNDVLAAVERWLVLRDRKSTRLNSSHLRLSRMPSSA